MYSSIISDVRKEEKFTYYFLMAVVMIAAAFEEHRLIILGGACVFYLFEIMIRLQAIIKVLKRDEND